MWLKFDCIPRLCFLHFSACWFRARRTATWLLVDSLSRTAHGESQRECTAHCLSLVDFRARRRVRFSGRMETPWSIDRDKYGSDQDGFRRYLYCLSWSELVIRAELANAIEVRTEDETEAVHLKRTVATS